MEAGALLEMKRFCHARTVSSPCGVFPVRWSCPPASSTHTARAPSPPPPPAVAHPARRGGGVEFFLDPPATSLFFSRLPGRPPVRHSDATGRPAVTLSFPQLSRSQQRRRRRAHLRFGRPAGWRVFEQARTMVPHHPRCGGRPERFSRADDNCLSRVLPRRSRKAQKSSLRLGFLVKDSQIMAPCNDIYFAHF